MIYFCSGRLRDFLRPRGCMIFFVPKCYVIFFVPRGCVIFVCPERSRDFFCPETINQHRWLPCNTIFLMHFDKQIWNQEFSEYLPSQPCPIRLPEQLLPVYTTLLTPEVFVYFLTKCAQNDAVSRQKCQGVKF